MPRHLGLEQESNTNAHGPLDRHAMRERCVLSPKATGSQAAWTKRSSTGAMRCRQPRCALHQLCGLFDRMQDPAAQEEEGADSIQRFRQVREDELCLLM